MAFKLNNNFFIVYKIKPYFFITALQKLSDLRGKVHKYNYTIYSALTIIASLQYFLYKLYQNQDYLFRMAKKKMLPLCDPG